MLRLTNRLFNDKDIGKVILTGVRRYTIGNSEWEKYNNQITHTYSSNFRHIDIVLNDTVVSQTNKIRELEISNNNLIKEMNEIKSQYRGIVNFISYLFKIKRT
jgi:hypothetical protein